MVKLVCLNSKWEENMGEFLLSYSNMMGNFRLQPHVPQ